MELPREFDVIARYFRPLAGPAALGLADDAALLEPPPGRALVLSADAMVQGVHFLVDDPPDLVARKLLRVNLSDLAAMGAAPLGYLLTLAIPRATPDEWFAGFAAGLLADQTEFGVALLGGDTTSTPGPVCLSLTILGTVTLGHALTRTGAQMGDDLWVSGTIGDGALGLLAARGEIEDPEGFLADRYRLPRPRLSLGSRLYGIAAAAMDVSDGLVQDVAHLGRAAGLAARIELARIPLSGPARRVDRVTTCLTGGDDYELVFAAAPARREAVHAAAHAAEVDVTRIGAMRGGPIGSVFVESADGQTLMLDGAGGWSHLGA